jgi:hypothetical protein
MFKPCLDVHEASENRGFRVVRAQRVPVPLRHDRAALAAPDAVLDRDAKAAEAALVPPLLVRQVPRLRLCIRLYLFGNAWKKLTENSV